MSILREKGGWMKRYLVTRTVKLSHIVEATSKAEALAMAGDLGEHTSDLHTTETVKILHGSVPKNLPGARTKQRE